MPHDPDHPIYDRAVDSDPLRTQLLEWEIELVCPHRKNRVKPAKQDGRASQQYQRRWKVERTISWLFNFRRLVVWYKKYSHLFLGFAQITCVFTLLNKLRNHYAMAQDWRTPEEYFRIFLGGIYEQGVQSVRETASAIVYGRIQVAMGNNLHILNEFTVECMVS